MCGRLRRGSTEAAAWLNRDGVEARSVAELQELDRVDSLLVRASGLVIGYTGQDFEPAPYPEAVESVAAGMVARVLTAGASAPVFAEQQNAGPFGIRYSGDVASGDVWLSKADKLILRPYRKGGGLSSVQFVGERYEITPDA